MALYEDTKEYFRMLAERKGKKRRKPKFTDEELIKAAMLLHKIHSSTADPYDPVVILWRIAERSVSFFTALRPFVRTFMNNVYDGKNIGYDYSREELLRLRNEERAAAKNRTKEENKSRINFMTDPETFSRVRSVARDRPGPDRDMLRDDYPANYEQRALQWVMAPRGNALWTASTIVRFPSAEVTHSVEGEEENV